LKCNALLAEFLKKQMIQVISVKIAISIQKRSTVNLLKKRLKHLLLLVNYLLKLIDMKKIIIIITALELLTACGVSRRAVKTEITSEVTQQTLTTDTTSRATTWEQLVTAISNQIDLSKIHIINYSPERDSTGKQIIDSEIKIDRNVTTTTKADVKESKEEQENRITTESTDTQAKEQTKQETKEKTGSSPLRLYLIIALLTAVLLLIIYIKYKSVIRSVIKKIIGTFT